MQAEITEALLALRAHPVGDAPTREVIVAYARLAALASHWPDRVGTDILNVLQAHAQVREVELDRYLKQRRIQLAKLAELNNALRL